MTQRGNETPMPHWSNLLGCGKRADCKIEEDGHGYTCFTCKRTFPRGNNAVIHTDAGCLNTSLLETTDGKAMAEAYRAPSNKLSVIRSVISSEFSPGKAWRAAKQATLETGPCLIIGSGVTRYKGAVHLDIDDFPGVDIVADAAELPFRANRFNGAICEVVLEHVAEPQKVIDEVWRVLKPGGQCFFIVPFLFPYHGHPSDFQRWSQQGLAQAFQAFDQLEIGIHAGPCSAMVNLLTEWAYLLTGFSYPRGYFAVKGAATALLFPLKYLDLWANRLPEAHRMASTLYVKASKPQDRD